MTRHPRSEHGFVMLQAMALMAVGLLLGAVAIVSAGDLANTSNTDQRAKAALAAADAGAQTALLRLNTLQQTLDSLVTLQPCVLPTVDATTGVASALTVNATVNASDGWCPATSAEKVGNGESFRYQVTPTAAVASRLSVPGGPATVALSLDRKIVSTGTLTTPAGAQVQRRVLLDVAALDGTNILNPIKGGYTVSATNSVTVKDAAFVGTSAKHADVISAGAVSRLNSGQLCGTVTYFSGSAPTTNCAGTTTPQQSADAQTLLGNLPAPSTSPSGVTIDSAPTNCSTLLGIGCTWTAATKTMIVNGLPLGLTSPSVPAGHLLKVCRVDISAGQLGLPGTASNPSILYLLASTDPACAGTANPGVHVTGSGQVCNSLACTSLTNLGDPSGALLEAANGATITFGNSSSGLLATSAVSIVAPGATVNLQNNSELIGGVLAKDITLANNSNVQSSALINLNLSVLVGKLLSLPSKLLPIYTVKSYKECKPTPPTSDPMSGC